MSNIFLLNKLLQTKISYPRQLLDGLNLKPTKLTITYNDATIVAKYITFTIWSPDWATTRSHISTIENRDGNEDGK